MILNARYAAAIDSPEPENSQFPGSRTAISGLRYYSPSLGRFVCRDPKEEMGGINLYAFIRNNAVNGWDYLGMNAGFFSCGWSQVSNTGWTGDDLRPPSANFYGPSIPDTPKAAPAGGPNAAPAGKPNGAPGSLPDYTVTSYRNGTTVGSVGGSVVSVGRPNGSVSTLNQTDGNWNTSFDFAYARSDAPNSGAGMTAMVGMVTTAPWPIPNTTANPLPAAARSLIQSTGAAVVDGLDFLLSRAGGAILVFVTPNNQRTDGAGDYIQPRFDPDMLGPILQVDANMRPFPGAVGPHTTFKVGPNGEITNYQDWFPQSNSRNPAPWESGRRVDVTGKDHGGIPTPHVHEPDGTVRPATPSELPHSP